MFKMMKMMKTRPEVVKELADGKDVQLIVKILAPSHPVSNGSVTDKTTRTPLREGIKNPSHGKF